MFAFRQEVLALRSALSICTRLGRILAVVLVVGLLVGLVAAPALAAPCTVWDADGNCIDETWFPNDNMNYNLQTITTKIMGILTWVFGVIAVCLTALVAKQGFAIAMSGSNPQARAQAQAGLWSVILGSAIFWLAAVISAVIRNIANVS